MILSLFYTSNLFFWNLYYFRTPSKQAYHQRIYLESMGPAFIKLGQLLSVHPLWLNKFQLNEFSKLRDGIGLKKTILNNYYHPYQNLSINPVSFANGSIASVHLGKYRNQDVVVKIKKTNTQSEMKWTFKILKPFIYLTQYIPIICNWNLYNKFKVINNIMENQCDFNLEAKNLIRFQKLYGNIVKIPKVFSEVSNENQIVMEYLPSETTDEILKKISKKEKDYITKKMFGFLITSINFRGIFHSDLHNGNFGWIKENGKYELVLYDFGLIGELTKPNLKILNDFFISLINKDINNSINNLNKFLIDNSNCLNTKKFHDQIKKFLLDRFKKNDLNIITWILEILNIINKYNLQLRNDFTNIDLAFISLDGIVSQLAISNKNYFDFMRELII